jgi:hypothetical protein
MHRTEGKTTAIHKALETLCYVHGCGSVAIESAQIHFETGGGVARQLYVPSSLYQLWAASSYSSGTEKATRI